jgi:hypothetical protein
MEYLPGGKVAWVCAGNTPPSSAERKNVWSYTSDPPTCVHGVGRDNFNFYFHKECMRPNLRVKVPQIYESCPCLNAHSRKAV